MAVSETFWKMVKETVEQQADAFKGRYWQFDSDSILVKQFDSDSILV